ncbi:hypothetical protein AVEN_10884-1 [Araneus ventricosus]|uniref:MATH domain-containing protein n=1 Tax=Araneus ventricosus TaxID=182803 RepID=A0A4Y1ZN29_ARAVE|nr:hypothetical protein AVEN_120676-1 [Araneus ventricosus]GBL59745.1 hypothetical protein AVEN_155746-1 [Araneus ventricosus]GBL59828.1 hypothetical protein AVEN_260979-1 [Araneus ventricosus]GBL59838.1 hypothetical protein AVEN_10884-1 [Araneus ventricosus]
MAANNNGIERVTHHSNTGHKFIFVFSVQYLSVKKEFTFKEEFNTECEASPTAWSCEMFFQKVLDDGRACILVTLRRKGYGRNPVKACISLYIKDSAEKYLFNSPKIERERIVAGEVIEEHLVENLPFPEMRSYFNLRLKVAVFIDIISCHSTTGKINSETFRQQKFLYDRL